MSSRDSDTFADLDLDLDDPTETSVAPDGPRFRIDDELARGGLGRVHRGFDLLLHREVAIKQLLHDAPTSRARFDRESRLTARLQHPNIVPIYDAGSDENGLPYLAMRLVHGRSLQDVIDETPELDDRLALLPHVIAACNAVAYAHGQRICHRDLKPDNILVGAYGETVVIDWGLAKDLDDDEALPASESTHSGVSGTSLTRVGTVMGTPAYMPPEQAAGRPATEAADVYALGAVLYHLLAGVRPYHQSQDTLAAVASEAPPAMDTVVHGIPPDLTAIVEKAMQRRVERRYPSAAELAHDLERFEAGRWVEAYAYSRTERIGRWVRRHKGATALASLLALTILAALIGLTRANRIATDRAEALAELQAEQRLQLDRRTLEQAELLASRDPVRALKLLDGLSAQHPFDGRVHAVASTIRTARPPRELANPDDVLVERLVGNSHGALAAGGTEALVFDEQLELVRTVEHEAEVVALLATEQDLLYCAGEQLFDASGRRPMLPLPQPCWLLHETSSGVLVQTDRALFRLDDWSLELLGELPECRTHWVGPTLLWTLQGDEIVAHALRTGLPELARAPYQYGVEYGRLTDHDVVVLLGSEPALQLIALEGDQVRVRAIEVDADWLVAGTWIDEQTLVVGGDSERVHVVDVPTGEVEDLTIRGRPYHLRSDDGSASVVTDAGALFVLDPAGPYWVTRELGGSTEPLNRLARGPHDQLLAAGRARILAQPLRSDEGRAVAWLGAHPDLFRTGGTLYGTGARGLVRLTPTIEVLDERDALAVSSCGGHRWVLAPDSVWSDAGHELALPSKSVALVCSGDERFAIVVTADDQARVLDPRTGLWISSFEVPGARGKDQRNHRSMADGVVMLGEQAWRFREPGRPPTVVGNPLHGPSSLVLWNDQVYIGARSGEIVTGDDEPLASMNALVSTLEVVDGQLFAGDYFGGVARWRRPDSEVERIAGHTQYVQRMVVNPRGRWLASSAWDGRTWIWDSEPTPVVGRMLPEQVLPMFRLGWSEDGETLYTADRRGVVRRFPHDVPAEPEALRAWVHERANPRRSR